MMYYPNYFTYGFGRMGSALSLLGRVLGGGVVPLASVAIYVFTALSLYTIARKRGIACPWLAWLPVANLWLLGSVSDQYRYLTHGQLKHKRVTLLVLDIAAIVLAGCLAATVFALIAGAVSAVIPLIVVLLLLLGVGVALTVVRFMALYDVYASCDPENAALYLVLSVIFRFLQPIFLFLSRNLEKGMPPRKQAQQETSV